MGKPNFSDEFKRDAVAQITERGYPVAEVSQRLGVSPHSLYAWKRQLANVVSGDAGKDAEISQLKRELARVTEERDILKNVWPAPFARGILKCSDSVCVNVYGLMGDPMAKMDIRTSGATIKTPATSAIFLAGLSRRRSTVRPSSRSFLQTSLAYARRCVRPIRLCRDWVAAFERCVLAQGRPCDPRQLVGQRDDDGIAVDSSLNHSCQPASQRGLASRQ